MFLTHIYKLKMKSNKHSKDHFGRNKHFANLALFCSHSKDEEESKQTL